MSRLPLHLPDITTTDLRAVKRLAGQLMEAPDLDTLGRELIEGAGKILPADFMVWNLWTPAMDELLGFEANHTHHHDKLDRLGDALNATIHHHPVIAAGQMEYVHLKPQRMSDYQSGSAFKSNPLFQEVYRHIDSHYQVAYKPAKFSDCQIILSWNLRNRDFTDHEVQLLHLLGMQVGVISRRIEERRHMQAAWEALAGSLGTISGKKSSFTAAGLPTLAMSEGRILSGIIRGETRADIATSLKWRRDRLDRQLGALRERLGLESTAQLMQALAELKPPN
jgi:hypothetical protein